MSQSVANGNEGGSKTADGGGKIPLRLRLKAWWEGYDAEDLARYEALHDARLPAATESKPKRRKQQETNEAATRATAADTTASDDPRLWNDSKINIAQYIWGEGFCGPGGPNYIVALSKLMALSPEMSMLQLGCGLGGPARVLADRFGVWISGFDESPQLIERGNILSEKAGLAKKAQLDVYNPADFEGFERKYDRALVKEAFFTIEDKDRMVEAIEDKLKPGGLLLITDYVLGRESAVGSDAYKAWKIGERSTPYPMLAGEMTDCLKRHRLQVRVSEDISDSYIAMINDAWAGAADVAAALIREENGREMVKLLMQEAEFWTRRRKMLESGDLRLWRIVANKKSSGPSMMSDW